MQGQTSAEWPYFPFCCRRCRLIDLGRWLDEDYRLAPENEGEVPAASHGNDLDIP
jgi:endogenous inhibitor of DNA gyrase (YacG/DUF329 family)